MLDIARLTDIQTRDALPHLMALLEDAANSGASVGFLRPLDARLSEAYWQDVIAAVAVGSRMLLAARELMTAIEDEARRARRSLLVLDTESGSDAVPFYESQQWLRRGSIPDFALSTDGVPTANILYYKRV